ncbi:MAG: hypothetical protein FJW27_01770 [Acidimicrobiia bacterium]|nr:hypothetical protein [Acidimicrobiia bacterium]
MTTRGGIAVGVSCCALLASVAAQGPGPSLSAVKTLQCALTLQTAGSWKSTEPQSETKPIRMALRYEEVDTDDGTARFVGSSGRTDVAARFVRDALTFIHSGTDGSVALTTVSRSAPDGKWLAVHTRHEFSETSSTGVTLGPAQYYGTCTIER